LIESWKILINDNPDWEELIQPGLDKLGDYKYDLDDVPAYYLALGNIFFWCHNVNFHLIFALLALDPRVKLTELAKELGGVRHDKARKLLISEVRYSIEFGYSP
jgi:hypothetical protein